MCCSVGSGGAQYVCVRALALARLLCSQPGRAGRSGTACACSVCAVSGVCCFIGGGVRRCCCPAVHFVLFLRCSFALVAPAVCCPRSTAAHVPRTRLLLWLFQSLCYAVSVVALLLRVQVLTRAAAARPTRQCAAAQHSFADSAGGTAARRVSQHSALRAAWQAALLTLLLTDCTPDWPAPGLLSHASRCADNQGF